MTKAELIEEVSRVVEMTRKDSEIIVETIFDSIVASLHGGYKIEIRGFGSFRTRQRQPRVGRNPKTGTRVEVPSKRIPYFKHSKKTVLDAVDGYTRGRLRSILRKRMSKRGRARGRESRRGRRSTSADRPSPSNATSAPARR